ncbi:cysteine desulfurase [Fructobacillus ficulneus]|uniref:Cysteine desulfurase n=1 Tax=Fructobacillus ficulneus TaxID=157463 RepID=A0A0K8MGD9_9LACO|nr:cysteine desulfurase [Fructobacillus ficulneus]GAO99595.1 selenocysteine lyase, cysteine desulfurase [Fructobacillus ficulneus]
MKTVRSDFEILKKTINNQPLTYLDTAATSQKPNQVLAAIQNYYLKDNANVHRGVYTLSEQATQAYEDARTKVGHFLNAPSARNIVFTRSTTESLNWLAQSFGPGQVEAGDEILLTYLEHHSNIVPWQVLAQKTGAKLKYVGLTEDGQVDLVDFADQLTTKTKIVSFAHVSNVLGTLAPVKKMVAMAHEVGARVIVDGAQAVAHLPVDVQDLDVDFYAFSGHKVYGPTGIGVLYGRTELLEAMEPAQYGGEMIEKVGLESSTFQPAPWKFEAGTPNIAGAIGLGAALDYMQELGLAQVSDYETDLMEETVTKLLAIPGLTLYGPQNGHDRYGVAAFNLAGVHPHDVATILDQEGVEVRAGHHCAQPLMAYLGLPATVRVSLGVYNNSADIDRLCAGLHQVREYFAND